MDLLDLFDRGTAWTSSKVAGAKGKLDDPTPCADWKVRDLINHLFEAQSFFVASAKGQQAPQLKGSPPDVLTDDPGKQYEEARQETLSTYRAEGVLEKTGPSLGIAFVDQLVHGWDLAKATGQDTRMPDDLAQAAFRIIDGRMTDEQRGTFFKPAVKVPDDASVQDKLLAYGGRNPN